MHGLYFLDLYIYILCVKAFLFIGFFAVKISGSGALQLGTNSGEILETYWRLKIPNRSPQKKCFAGILENQWSIYFRYDMILFFLIMYIYLYFILYIYIIRTAYGIWMLIPIPFPSGIQDVMNFPQEGSTGDELLGCSWGWRAPGPLEKRLPKEPFKRTQ